jgi:hypothetical protein
LDHLLIFGLGQLQKTLDCYISYFNELRPHQGIDNKIPAEYNKSPERQGGCVPNIKVVNIRCQKFLGGLLKSYKRAA